MLLLFLSFFNCDFTITPDTGYRIDYAHTRELHCDRFLVVFKDDGTSASKKMTQKIVIDSHGNTVYKLPEEVSYKVLHNNFMGNPDLYLYVDTNDLAFWLHDSSLNISKPVKVDGAKLSYFGHSIKYMTIQPEIGYIAMIEEISSGHDLLEDKFQYGVYIRAYKAGNVEGKPFSCDNNQIRMIKLAIGREVDSRIIMTNDGISYYDHKTGEFVFIGIIDPAQIEIKTMYFAKNRFMSTATRASQNAPIFVNASPCGNTIPAAVNIYSPDGSLLLQHIHGTRTPGEYEVLLSELSNPMGIIKTEGDEILKITQTGELIGFDLVTKEINKYNYVDSSPGDGWKRLSKYWVKITHDEFSVKLAQNQLYKETWKGRYPKTKSLMNSADRQEAISLIAPLKVETAYQKNMTIE